MQRNKIISELQWKYSKLDDHVNHNDINFNKAMPMTTPIKKQPHESVTPPSVTTEALASEDAHCVAMSQHCEEPGCSFQTLERRSLIGYYEALLDNQCANLKVRIT